MMRRCRLACVVTMVGVAAATPAEAAWGWLEKLSGPGPFGAQTPAVNFEFVCVYGSESGSPTVNLCRPLRPVSGAEREDRDVQWQTYRSRLRGFVGLEVQRWESRENLLFERDPRDPAIADPVDPRGDFAQVRIFELRPNVMMRVHEAVDVGLGLGLHWFSGDAFDSFFRLSVEPLKLSFAPAALFSQRPAARIVKVNAGVRRFRGEFTNEDFCDPPQCNVAATRPFSAEGEYLWHSSVLIDLSALLWTF